MALRNALFAMLLLFALGARLAAGQPPAPPVPSVQDIVAAALAWDDSLRAIRACDLVATYFQRDALVVLLNYELSRSPMTCDWAWVDRPKFTADPLGYLADPAVLDKIIFAWHNEGNVSIDWMQWTAQTLPPTPATTQYLFDVRNAYAALDWTYNVPGAVQLRGLEDSSGYPRYWAMSVDAYEALLTGVRDFRAACVDRMLTAMRLVVSGARAAADPSVARST
jgi:hypothetical protein